LSERGESVDAAVTITSGSERLRLEDAAKKLCERAELPFC
jgi:hypothetical protein